MSNAKLLMSTQEISSIGSTGGRLNVEKTTSILITASTSLIFVFDSSIRMGKDKKLHPLKV